MCPAKYKLSLLLALLLGILTVQCIFQLTFEGIIGTGTQGDISLDDVSVSDKCNGMLW